MKLIFILATQLEEAVEHADRQTLFEWYDHAYGLKELLNLVEEGAQKCGCEPMGPPILDTQDRINHALNTISNKLRYGKNPKARYDESEDDEDSDDDDDDDDE